MRASTRSGVVTPKYTRARSAARSVIKISVGGPSMVGKEEGEKHLAARFDPGPGESLGSFFPKRKHGFVESPKASGFSSE
jgi:hypothetical protein